VEERIVDKVFLRRPSFEMLTDPKDELESAFDFDLASSRELR